ncbi:MAG TPA: hypothetical protein GXX53_04610 [Tissierellia bacterium]|nr:hypothetical protein [Tissierellia bacterium]
MNIRVGIPRSMFYFDYFSLWKRFFECLGAEVIISPRTNKHILNRGVNACVDESCLPVKVFHGHVDYLKDKVDCIFIPKIISTCKREYNCPKHLGLPDMIKHSFSELPCIIDIEVNLRKSDRNLKKSVLNAGSFFEKRKRRIYNAFNEALKQYDDYVKMMTKGIIPLRTFDKNDDMSLLSSIIRKDYNRTILVLGHSYNIYDQFINMGLIKKLKNLGFDIVTAEMVEEKRAREYAAKLPKRMFWTNGQRIIGAAYSLIDEKSISGIIYVSAFGCGLDSVFIDLVERKAKEARIPFTLLTIDEQTGEAGVNTRVEAFTDMLDWRKKDEDNISTLW